MLSSCAKQEVELLFEKKPEERMLERNAELRNILLGSTNGWKGVLRTSLRGGSYGFYMNFGSNEAVEMYSDWSATSANTKRASSYRIQYVMNTSLIFDTYNYITIMQDPDISVNGGSVGGDGLRSDIEFEYVRSTPDSVILRGKKYLNFLYLVKATSEEKAAFEGGNFASSISEINTYMTDVINKYIEVPFNGSTVKLGFNFNIPNKLVSAVVQLPDNTVQSTNGGFGHLMNEIVFNNTIDILGIKFVGIKKKAVNSYVVIDASGVEYPLNTNSVPVVSANVLFEGGSVIATVPRETTFTGWGTDFITRRATVNTSLGGWNIGGSPLSMGEMSLRDLNPTSKIFMLRIVAPYGTTFSNLDYQYRLVVNPDGSYKFNYMSALTGNAGTVIASTNALLLQRINVDTFKLDYYTDSVTNVTYLRFSSVENPDFVFTCLF